MKIKLYEFKEKDGKDKYNGIYLETDKKTDETLKTIIDNAKGILKEISKLL